MGVFRGDGSPRNIDLFSSTSHQRSSGQASQDDEVQKPVEKPLFFTTPQRGACKKKPRAMDMTVRGGPERTSLLLEKADQAQQEPGRWHSQREGGKREREVLEIQQQQ